MAVAKPKHVNVSVSISDAFDGGNIKFINTRQNENDPDNITDVLLHIKPDIYTELEKIGHMQYFSFRSTVGGLGFPPSNKKHKIRYFLENAEAASYPEAWPGTTVFYSTNIEDPDSWRRNLETNYSDGQLVWEHEHTQNGSVFFSYFPPYSYSRHLGLVSRCSKYADIISLGHSLDGRDIECISLGKGKIVCWFIHRQHPGETMASYYAEGLLTRLLGLDSNGIVDEDVQKLTEMYTFYIVPLMCPDGAVRGHLRTNACGANLNREWATKRFYEAPSLERSPEVYAVMKKMDDTGVDIFLDIHGDEELPFNFIAGAQKTPKWGKRMESLHGAFVAAYQRANSDMQQRIGYPAPESPEAALQYMNVASNQIATRFDCLSMTLEMPFKDCLSNSDPERGWSPDRSCKLGASVLSPLEYIHPYLRVEGEFWTQLPPEDAYVPTTDEYEAELRAANEGGFVPLSKTQRFYSDVHACHPSKQT
jgi:murein tripeptide amidase MpaA